MKRVILAENQKSFRSFVRNAIKDKAIIIEACNGEELIQKYKTTNPDVIITDLTMPVITGREAIERIRMENKTVIIGVLTIHETKATYRDVAPFINGFIGKETEDDQAIIYKINQLISVGTCDLSSSMLKKLTGKSGMDLTAAEEEIAGYIVNGLCSLDIAKIRGNSVFTIQAHRRNITKKLKVKNTAELVAALIERELVNG
ncbi:oxygen regulatory protein NreC [bacterium BMS3Abin03]|nr:oxygen regulatory protein NreC [bacterium BMS3Abin03]